MDPKSARRLLAGLAFAAACAGPARASTITVNSAADTVADDGECTLREAIIAANRNVTSGSASGECEAGTPPDPSGANDIIAFFIRGSGPVKISPATPLPAVTEAVLIDGYTQPGAKANTLQSGSDAKLMLDLRGDMMAPDCDAASKSPVAGGAFQFVDMGASGSRLRGFAITGFVSTLSAKATIVIFRAGGVQVDGNFIGFDTEGREFPNEGFGIVVMNGWFERLTGVENPIREWFDDGGVGNLIGGSSPQERNVIGGGTHAVFLAGQGNRVEGNYLGVDPQGLQSIPARLDALTAGQLLVRSCRDSKLMFHYTGQDNSIGGFTGGRTNLFSASSNHCAVRLGTSGNRVEGNFMGTDRDGGAGAGGQGLGARPYCGVLLVSGGHRNVITYNRIAFNGKGVVVGEFSSSLPPIGNDLYANSIFSNAGIGIDLGDDSITVNDPGDKDQGPNNRQNFPEALGATATGVRGEVSGTPNVEQRIDFYQNRRCDSSGNGEGEKYLGSTSVLTDANGKASFNVALAGLEVERVVTATATTYGTGTSEFSACATVFPGLGLAVEVQSSRNPARSHETFELTVLAHGVSRVVPTGVVMLLDVAHTISLPNGQIGFHILGSGSLVPGAGDTALAKFDSTSLRRRGSEWGNLRIRAQYLGDGNYAATDSADFVEHVYREKSDMNGDGLSDLVLCDSSGAKYLVQDIDGTYTIFPLSSFGRDRTVLGTGEFGPGSEPAIVWRNTTGTIGGTTFAGAAPQQDFTVPLPSGLTFEGLGSMYGDLKDDFIVRDVTGQHFGVLTSSIAADTLLLLRPWPVSTPNNFLVEQVGDFDGDGNLDWSYRHPSSMAHVVWLIDTFRVIGGGTLSYVPIGGTVAATGDFDGDARTDFVWTLASGDTEIVLQNGIVMVNEMILDTAARGQVVVGTALLDDGTGNASSNGRSSLIVRTIANGALEAWINTGLNGGLPVFGTPKVLPSTTGMTMCVP